MLRVVLVSEDPLARSGLSALLRAEPEFALERQLSPSDDVVHATAQARPDVVVWDIGIDGEVVENLRNLHVPILALVPHESAASDALAAGARGVLLRTETGAKLPAALRAVAEGLWVLDDAMTQTAARMAIAQPRTSDVLTAREDEVLRLLADGLSNKEIAQRLGISEHTAKFHVNAILSKLGVQSRTEAVVQAARRGWLAL